MSRKVIKTEEEVAAFWAKENITEHLDMSKAKRASFPNLKPSTQTIAIRLPVWLLENIRQRARKQDVPYQSLIKIMLAETVSEPRA